MPVETFQYLNSLNSSYPASTDGVLQGDDHLRGIKLVLGNTFPGVDAPLVKPHGSGRALTTLAVRAPSGSKTDPAYTFEAEPTLGLYRASTGLIKVVGGRLEGAVPAGALQAFAMTTAPAGWLPCDGQTVSKIDYPDLFAAIGYTYGGTGDNFVLPDALNRYFRHRQVGGAAGAVAEAHHESVGLEALTQAVYSALYVPPGVVLVCIEDVVLFIPADVLFDCCASPKDDQVSVDQEQWFLLQREPNTSS